LAKMQAYRQTDKLNLIGLVSIRRLKTKSKQNVHLYTVLPTALVSLRNFKRHRAVVFIAELIHTLAFISEPFSRKLAICCSSRLIQTIAVTCWSLGSSRGGAVQSVR